MVLLGFGSLMCIYSSSFCVAELPVSIQSSTSSDAVAPVAWHTTLQSGWKESRRSGLPMVIFITTNDCVYCDAMKQNTWCDKQVLRRLAGKFIPIRLNPLHNRKTLDRIDVDTYPTTLLGSPKGKVIGHRIGYQPPAAVQSFLSEAQSDLALAHENVNTIH
jgi:protein disulfide-isomerase